MDTKYCPTCGVTGPVEAFGTHRNKKDGLQHECKGCKLQRDRAREQRFPRRRLESWLRTKYNLTLEQYDIMFSRQSGVCAICHQAPGARRLNVDHDHSCCPGIRSCGACVRGLLCINCNRALERIENVPLWSERASAYVRSRRLRSVLRG